METDERILTLLGRQTALKEESARLAEQVDASELALAQAAAALEKARAAYGRDASGTHADALQQAEAAHTQAERALHVAHASTQGARADLDALAVELTAACDRADQEALDALGAQLQDLCSQEATHLAAAAAVTKKIEQLHARAWAIAKERDKRNTGYAGQTHDPYPWAERSVPPSAPAGLHAVTKVLVGV